MKHKTFISLIGLLLLASISFIGCNDDGGGGSSQGTQALTEIDFANNPSLQADPDNEVIVDFLEAPGSDTPQYDTGEVGVDEVPFTYPDTVEQTICWEDDDQESMHYMVLLDSQGEEVLRVDVNGDCMTDTIEAGDYVMELHHDGSTGDPLPIFISTNPDQNQQSMKTDGLFNGFKAVVAKILRGIQNTISKEATAQTFINAVDTLLTTNSCQNCYLFRANLYHADLTGADLRGAYLRRANLNGATLVGADLRGADLLNANFYQANLTNIKLTIRHEYIRPNHPEFSNNDRYYIEQAQGATFWEATWCDGTTICGFPSLGTCCSRGLQKGNCVPRRLPVCGSFQIIGTR